MSQIVDKQVIVQRSKTYGNNFPFLVKIWKNFFKLRYNIDVPLTPQDVATMFSLHKISRLANAPEDTDTLRDMLNYAWLGTSYDEYISLLQQQEDTQVVPMLKAEDMYCYLKEMTCRKTEEYNSCSHDDSAFGYECSWLSPKQIN